MRSWMSGDASPTPRPTYDLIDDRVTAPALPGRAIAAPDFDRLIDTIAADLVIHAENCVRQFGDFHLVLTGGDIPLPLYTRLMVDPNYRRLPWRRTHLWVTSDSTGPDEPAFTTVRDTIADHADIPAEQVHPILPHGDDPAGAYEAELTEALSWREKGQDRLDYVLLIPAPDGVAPGLRASAHARLVAAEVAGDATTVALTLRPINAARFVSVLLTGAAYAPLVRRLTEPSAEKAPIARVSPINGELTWYLDADACADGDSAAR